MKKLIVIRHAKADGSFTGADFDKPLQERGRQAAPLIAKKIISRGIQHPFILCSGALRTQQTLSLMNTYFQVPQERIIIDPDLYLAAAQKLLNAIQQTPDAVDELILIAHNPGVTALINSLAQESIINVPTAGTACILFDTPKWQQLQANGKLGYYIFPKMFNS